MSLWPSLRYIIIIIIGGGGGGGRMRDTDRSAHRRKMRMVRDSVRVLCRVRREGERERERERSWRSMYSIHDQYLS